MRSLWTDPNDRHYPVLEHDTSADIAIVGGGLSGLGAALELHSSGATVVLLEERTIAAGASGRNAGFILAGPAEGYGQSVARLGEHDARDLWRFTEANNRRIARLVDEFEIDCGYLRRGSMSLAADDAEWEDLQADGHRLLAGGVSCCLIENGSLPRPFDCLYRGGLYYGGNAEMDPARFLRALAAVAKRVSIHEGTAVLSLSHQGRWRVRTARATIEAQQVLICTNAYTSRLLPSLPIAPRRGQVGATAVLDNVLVPFPMYANRGYQYWRQTNEGRLLVGGWRNLDPEREVGEVEILHEDIQMTLEDFARRIIGETATLEHRWAGIMGFTPDRMPLAGALDAAAGLYIAAGYSGHGVAQALSCGAGAAMLMRGGENVLPACFDPARFGQFSGAM